jgi:UDP-3-O-[3-hydroxymyristoyl] glucosamine N-acyltransferase
MEFRAFVEQLQIPLDQTSLVHLPEHNPLISGVAAIELATSTQLSFVEGERYGKFIDSTQAGVLILPPIPALVDQANQRGIAWLTTPQPRLAFAQALGLFYQPYQPSPHIHPSATIDPSVKLGEGVAISAQVVIGAGVEIGNQVCIHPHVVIYPGATIGERTVLHSHAVIHERSQIGPDCVVHSGAVIGAEGFGFVPTAEGWYKMPQSGVVVLEAGVEVGCNSAIDRPSVGTTWIGTGTKIDNLVQIGHGCQIGPHCVIAGQAGLAGRVELGSRVVLAGQVGVVDQVKIGAGAVVLAQSGVPHDVEPGAMVCGSPALPNKQFIKAITIFRRLPELYQTLRQLQGKG